MLTHRHLERPTQAWDAARLLKLSWFALALLVLLEIRAYAQGPPLMNQNAAPAKRGPASVNQTATTVSDRDALKVNWLYGSYVPKEVPLIPLTLDQRWRLYVRSTYTTPGIYIKTVAFTLSDQVKNNPSEWGRTFDGFAKRVGTREAQFVLQNTLTALQMPWSAGSHATTAATAPGSGREPGTRLCAISLPMEGKARGCARKSCPTPGPLGLP